MCSVPNLKQLVRDIAVATIQRVGTQICDYQTGRPLGRVLIIPWRGKIHIIALGTAVRPVFLPQKRLTYWKQELGFTTHPAPDFPRTRDEADANARATNRGMNAPSAAHEHGATSAGEPRV